MVEIHTHEPLEKGPNFYQTHATTRHRHRTVGLFRIDSNYHRLYDHVASTSFVDFLTLFYFLIFQTLKHVSLSLSRYVLSHTSKISTKTWNDGICRNWESKLKPRSTYPVGFLKNRDIRLKFKKWRISTHLTSDFHLDEVKDKMEESIDEMLEVVKRSIHIYSVPSKDLIVYCWQVFIVDCVNCKSNQDLFTLSVLIG